MGFLSYKPYIIFFFPTTLHNKSTGHFHLISTSHHCWARRIKSSLLLYQRNQQAGWVAASGLIVEGTGAPEVEEVGRGAWWCLARADIPYPSGRSPWTSGTVRGQKQGGGCCRPSVPPPSGRTRPQRAQTASRSTSQKPKLDSEHKMRCLPLTSSLTFTSLKLTPTPISVFLWAQFWIFWKSLLFILYPPFSISITSPTTTTNSLLLLIKQAMTAILVSWNLDILLTQRPRPEKVASRDKL